MNSDFELLEKLRKETEFLLKELEENVENLKKIIYNYQPRKEEIYER